MASLLAETLQEILKHLDDDVSSIFSCLLVNRFWCRQAAPLLWRRPFAFLKSDKDANSVIKTWLACLGQQERLALIEKDIPLESAPTPIFIYPKLLVEFNFGVLDDAVGKWVNARVSSNLSRRRDVLNKWRITISLCKMVFKHADSLRTVNITKFADTMEIPNFTQIAGASELFSQLKEIGFWGTKELITGPELDNIQKWLLGVETQCRSITCLHLCPDLLDFDTQQQLFRIVQTQQPGIKELRFKGHADEKKTIVTALRITVNTLTKVEFYRIVLYQTIMEALALCTHVDTLAFISCTNCMRDMWDPLVGSALRIKNLYFHQPYRTRNTDMAPLIQTAGGNLEFLVLGQEYSLSAYQTISEFCPNISSLSIIQTSDSVSTMFPAISSSRNLRELSLRVDHWEGYATDDFLNQLAMEIPSCVSALNLDFPVSSGQLQTFLRACRARIERLGLVHTRKLTREHLEVIIDYAREFGSLRKVGFGGMERTKVFFDEELVREAKRYVDFIPNVWFDMYAKRLEAEFKVPQYGGLSWV